MGELRVKGAASLSGDLSNVYVKNGTLLPWKQVYVNQRVFEGGGDPEGHLELVLIREFPASAPTETPSTPTATAQADWDIFVSIGSNPTSYWRRVSLWTYPADTLLDEIWVAPGLTTSATFDFDSGSDGVMVRARVQYATSENAAYPGPYSAPSDVATISGGA